MTIAVPKAEDKAVAADQPRYHTRPGKAHSLGAIPDAQTMHVLPQRLFVRRRERFSDTLALELARGDVALQRTNDAGDEVELRIGKVEPGVDW